MSCCRHVTIEKGAEINTLQNTYRAILQQDPTTGVIISGLCNTPVEGHTVHQVMVRLQDVANAIDGIMTQWCLMVDPGERAPRIRKLRVGVAAGTRSFKRHDTVQYRHENMPTDEIGRLPERWIIRADTPEERELLQTRLDATTEAQEALWREEGALARLAANHPDIYVELPGEAT